ncbi:MAG: HDIG domain-containing metalloprotein [Solirubrobacterales bacterium]
MTLSDRLDAAPLIGLARRALPDEAGAWIVGGAVRDAILGREVTDLDLAVGGDPERAARALARAGDGYAFELSSEFATWRAAGRERDWQVDATALRGATIEADLGARDFTVGAVAVPLGGGEPIDPFGGIDDLERRRLRVVAADALRADPLRLLRAARLAADLGLDLEPGTAALVRAESRLAAEPAGERQLAELRRLIGGPDPLRGVALLDELGLTAAVLPELAALRGVEQGPNHHLDVYGHTLAVLEQTLAVESDLERFAGVEQAAATRQLLAEPLADEISHGTALRFGALLHDIGKPATKGERDGHVTFIGHDSAGAEIVGGICRRLRASGRLTRHLQALTRQHLRLGFMVHEAPLPRRRIHDYLRATQPVSADVTLLTVADRLSARGSGPFATEEAIEAHLSLARQILAAALEWRRHGPPEPLLRGGELAAELGIAPGPELGDLLAELEAAQYAGEVSTRDEALERARRLRG